jgi:hypothetical protein
MIENGMNAGYVIQEPPFGARPAAAERAGPAENAVRPSIRASATPGEKGFDDLEEHLLLGVHQMSRSGQHPVLGPEPLRRPSGRGSTGRPPPLRRR